MKKQKKQSKDQKIFIITACIIGVLLIVAIALLIAVLVRQNNSNQNYHKKLTETTLVDKIDKTPASETTEPHAGEYIPVDRAIDIALENIGANRNSVRDLDAELDYEFGQKVYEVTFDYNQYEYNYYINPETGEIIKSFKEIDY